jgi:hypothetical protein
MAKPTKRNGDYLVPLGCKDGGRRTEILPQILMARCVIPEKAKSPIRIR